MNTLRKLLDTQFLINALLVIAVVYFVLQLVPLGLQVANAKDGTSIFAFLIVIVSGVVKALVQPAILVALAALINLKSVK